MDVEPGHGFGQQGQGCGLSGRLGLVPSSLGPQEPLGLSRRPGREAQPEGPSWNHMWGSWGCCGTLQGRREAEQGRWDPTTPAFRLEPFPLHVSKAHLHL